MFRSHNRLSRQRGIALFIGLVFLVVLSLVAVIAMQSTFLEMRMATNVARQSEAFQISESARAVLTGPSQVSLFSQSLAQGGWPVSWGGNVPDSDFSAIGDCSAPWTDPTTCAMVLKFK
ncbi:MAG: PilX N-terminal domain-containing pilus assembly protein, partial [Rhodanobacteraceae bacterium]